MSEANEKPKKKVVPKKKKIEISQAQYYERLSSCSSSAQIWGVGGFIFTALGVPFVLHKLTFIPTRVELRVAAGLLGAVFATYHAALYAREKCLKDTQENYTILNEAP